MTSPGQPPYDPYDPYAQQPAPPEQWPPAGTPPVAPPKAKRKVWPWIVGGGAVLLVVIGSVGSGSESAGTSTAAGAVQPSVAAPAPAGPLTTFGNGTYLVGEDVAPGTYRSPAPQDGVIKLCYWDVQDASGKILDQGVANEGPSRATLKAGRTFTSNGCEDWSKVG